MYCSILWDASHGPGRLSDPSLPLSTPPAQREPQGVFYWTSDIEGRAELEVEEHSSPLESTTRRSSDETAVGGAGSMSSAKRKKGKLAGVGLGW